MSKKVFHLSHERARSMALEAVSQAPEGYKITVEPKGRSQGQNRFMWSCLRDISRQLQWPLNGRLEYLEPEDWKDIFSASLKQEQRLSEGLQGGLVMLGQRTSHYSVRDMNELIDLIQAFGNDKGVVWSASSLADFYEGQI